MVKVVSFLLFLLINNFSLFANKDVSVALELADVHYIKTTTGKVTTVNPTTFIGDTFRIKIIITGDQETTDNFEIRGLENFIQMGQANQSSVSIINGQTSIEKIATYTLQPAKTGMFSIGPVTLVQNGNTVTSNTVSLIVAKQETRQALNIKSNAQQNTSNQEQPEQESQNGQEELFCKLTTEKKEVFTDEPTIVTISIYHHGSGANIRGLRPPNFENCTVKEIKNTREYQKSLNGKVYSCIDKQFLIFPNKEGKLSIPSAQVIYHVQKKQKLRHSFFGEELFSDFFNLGVEEKAVASNPLELKVKKLPICDKPVDAVGTIESFTAIVDKKEASANEPIKLTLALHGNINFDLLLQPKLQLPPIFKSYDSTALQNSENKKSFEFIIQVPTVGSWSIPAQKFTYFDTNKNEYITLTTESINLTITLPDGQTTTQNNTNIQETDDSQNTQLTNQAVTQPTKPIVKDVNFIQEDVTATKEKQKEMSLKLFLIAILLIPSLFYIRKFLPKNFFKSKNVLTIYQNKLNKLLIEHNTGKLYNLFIDLLTELYGSSKEQFDEDWIRNKLHKEGFADEKINLFINFLNECAQYSFANSSSKQKPETDDFIKKANYWLVTLTNKGLQ